MSTLKIRVYYEDTDSGGVVYYANYLRFIERGRAEFLREFGIEQDKLTRDENLIFAVRSAVVNYRHPARFNQQIIIHTQLEKTRHASLVFAHKITNFEQTRVLFDAQIIIACLDAQQFSPRAIPRAILEKING